MNGSRSRRLFVVMFVGLTALAVWSYFRLVSGHRVAQVAAENLDRCRRLADQIDGLCETPMQAWLESQAPQEKLTLHVQQAAQTAQIDESSLIRIDPQPGHRVGETDYLSEPTLLQMRSVSLRQLVGFLKEVTAGQAALQVESICLSAPRSVASSEKAETWTAEVTLTQLVFSPKSAAPP
ncbi:MAG: hypothetical protein HQ567_21425 [Candidatus Nealsonbacteria bacterium]|nr:hypothetical protein [Candidatus Nealsonbacteria bacterium]